MLNNRDDDNKYEAPEESEYHFSDDEANYEIEPEVTPSEPTPVSQRMKFLTQLSNSKRMLLSLLVFLALIYVVYKMVAPSTPTPPTDIVPPPLVASPTPAQPVIATAQPVVPTQTIAPQQVAPAPQPQQPVYPAPAIPTTTVTVTQPAAQPTNVVAPVAQPTQVLPPTSVPPAPVPTVAAPVQTVTTQPVATTTTTVTQVPTNTMPPSAIPAPPGTPSALTTQTMTSDQLIVQQQGEYIQRINEFSAQNKAVQDQMQALNARVGNLESEINQLVQALTRSTPPPPPEVKTIPVQPQVVSAPRISYNVQAIIPGRAWLRADNGETVTVAEGDILKGVGRVTKIDPYDGVVEINVGGKIVSLSYGTGG